MADIQFADFGAALTSAAALRRNDADIEYRNALVRQKQNELDREAADAPHVSALLQGDRTALDRVSPQTAIKLAPYLDKLDERGRAQAKAAADYTASGANAILQADPAERPAIYQQILADGKARGFDLSRLPPQYTPQIEPMLRTYRQMAIPVLEHFKSDNKGLDPLPGQGGGAAAAISGIESGGKYDAVGPVANAQGNRAYGKYQVLDSNIAPWTQEVLGKAMSPQEFLANPQAQDAVFKAKFGQYQAKYGPEGAARAWFAGEGGMNNPNAKDVLGTTVQGYGQKFAQAYGPGASAPPGVAQGDGGPAMPGGDPRESVRGLKLPPGAAVRTINGVPVVKDGTVLITGPDGKPDFVPLPVRAEPKDRQPPPGYRLAADGQSLEFIPGGPADPSIAKRSAPMNNEQARDAGFADRMQQSNSLLDTLDKQGTDTFGRLAEMAGKGGNFLQTEEYQKFKQARADFINAQLRRESGAAISADEFKKADDQYFPQPGDKPEVIAQKAKNRRLAVDAMIRGAGPSYKVGGNVETGPAAPATSAPAPAAAPKAGPAVGAIEQGYRFKGGNPADKNSWERVQ